jgi:hypothetical protein
MRRNPIGADANGCAIGSINAFPVRIRNSIAIADLADGRQVIPAAPERVACCLFIAAFRYASAVPTANIVSSLVARAHVPDTE